MQQSKKIPESEIVRILADKDEQALAIPSGLEWWPSLLESFYGWSPYRIRPKTKIRVG